MTLAVGSFFLEVVGILSQLVGESNEFSLSMLGEIPVATYLLLGLGSVALIWRRSRPLVVLAVALAAGVIWDVAGLDGGPSLAILISLYGVGRFIPNSATSAGAVFSAIVVTVADDVVEGEAASAFAVSVGLVLGAWYLGRRVARRRAYMELLEERTAFLERERAALAARAVSEERTRIARELHDVVAHRVSMITVQAGAAQTVAGSDPDKAMQAMAFVEEAGRQALGELRQVLGVLRADTGGDARDPMRGVADIPELVSEMGAAGVDVSLAMEGIAGPYAAGVDLAAYRIIQEALTNVLKHAGTSPHARVHVGDEGGSLVLEVVDEGSGETAVPGSGQGLVGMRERVALLGGTFEAGRRPEGGFRVVARLPREGRAEQ